MKFTCTPLQVVVLLALQDPKNSSETTIDTTKTIHSGSPDSANKSRKQPRPRSLGKLKIIKSLDSICDMCDDMLNKKEQITLEKARSIEDLTASLERFGTLEEEEVSADLFAELDEVIGGFMQLSKQHFVVQVRIFRMAFLGIDGCFF